MKKEISQQLRLSYDFKPIPKNIIKSPTNDKLFKKLSTQETSEDLKKKQSVKSEGQHFLNQIGQ
jgi:hypothetical protein